MSDSVVDCTCGQCYNCINWCDKRKTESIERTKTYRREEKKRSFEHKMKVVNGMSNDLYGVPVVTQQPFAITGSPFRQELEPCSVVEQAHRDVRDRALSAHFDHLTLETLGSGQSTRRRVAPSPPHWLVNPVYVPEVSEYDDTDDYRMPPSHDNLIVADEGRFNPAIEIPKKKKRSRRRPSTASGAPSMTSGAPLIDFSSPFPNNAIPTYPIEQNPYLLSPLALSPEADYIQDNIGDLDQVDYSELFRY